MAIVQHDIKSCRFSDHQMLYYYKNLYSVLERTELATQMNVRIDEQLKRDGDTVLASVGLTPTRAVRALWEFAAEHRDTPEIVRDFFENGLKQGLENSRETQRRLDLRQLEETASACNRLREQFGLTPPDTLEELDYDALREQALYERLSERGLA